MFRKLPEGGEATVRVAVDGRDVRVPAGTTAAAAALLAGLTVTRTSPVSDAPRAPYCMMGACFECLMEIDGVANRQACVVVVAEGMQIRSQRGAPVLAA
jgi:predicted molibdopterin-dependent oxidoreductase YjgC